MTSNIETKTIQKELTINLTITDFANKAKELAEISLEKSKLEHEFEQIKAEYRGKISEKETAIEKIVQVIRDAKEVRTVDCEMIKDFDANEVRYVHDGAVVETRSMSASELQTELPIEDTATESENVQSVDEEIADIIDEETGKRSKRSAVDGVH